MRSKLIHVYSLLTSGEQDSSTENGRSRERERRIALTSLASIFARVLSAGVGLLTVPLTLHYLGSERYGLWMAISSIIAMLGFADLGIGNGLLNAVSKAHGNDNHTEIKEYFSSATLMLSGIACVIAIAFAFAYPFISWSSFFNVHTPLAIKESGQAVAAFVLCFTLNIPASLVQRLQLGLQMGFIANLWQAAGSIFALIAVLFVVHFQAGLPWLVAALSGAPIMAALINGGIFFTKIRPDLFPAISVATRSAATKVAHTGLLFLVLQIVGAITFSSDNFIIARQLGITAVTEYAVTDKMFSVIPLLMTTLMAPLWPAYGEAIARKDMTWVIRVLKKSLLTAAIGASLLSVTLVFFGTSIMKFWVGNAVMPPMILLASFGIWKVIESIGNATAMFLNGAHIVQAQVVFSSLTAVTAICLKLTLISHFGVIGAIAATIISYLMCFLTPCFYYINKLIHGPSFTKVIY